MQTASEGDMSSLEGCKRIFTQDIDNATETKNVANYVRNTNNVIHHRVGHPIESAIYAKTYLFSPTTPNAITKPC
jgi:hypothetical protein